MNPSDSPQEAQARPFVPLRRTAIVLGVVLLMDILVYGGAGMPSTLVAALGLFLLVSGSLLALGRGRRPLALNRLQRAGIYLALAILAVGAGRLQMAVMRRHADRVVRACQRYQAEHGAYPESLEALVPGYLEAIPSVNFALLSGSYHYSRRGLNDPPMLWYHDLGPASRQSYSFQEGRWVHAD